MFVVSRTLISIAIAAAQGVRLAQVVIRISGG